MSNPTGNEPALHRDSGLSGNEPELSGIQKCPTCGAKMQRNHFSRLVCMACYRYRAENATSKEVLKTDPAWLNPNDHTFEELRRIRGGLHPHGVRVSNREGAVCGNCAFNSRPTGLRCGWCEKDWRLFLETNTHSVIQIWPGCEHWQAKDGEL